MISIDLSKIPNNRALTISLTICATILSPYWFIFQFYRELFEKYDTVTLLLLCTSCGFGVMAVNFVILFLILFISETASRENVSIIENTSSLLSISSWYTIVVFYVPGFGTLIDKVQLREAIFASATLQLILVLVLPLYFLVGNNIIKRFDRNRKRQISQFCSFIYKASSFSVKYNLSLNQKDIIEVTGKSPSFKGIFKKSTIYINFSDPRNLVRESDGAAIETSDEQKKIIAFIKRIMIKDNNTPYSNLETQTKL